MKSILVKQARKLVIKTEGNIMGFGYVKGYDIITVSKKKAEKITLSEELSEAVDAEELRAKMLGALESGGRVYALSRKKKIYACCIFRKTKKKAEDFMAEDKAEKYKDKELDVYELIYEYRPAETDGLSEEVKKNFLADIKEQAAIYDIKAIIWGGDYYVPETEIGGKNYSGFLMGLSLGILFGIMFDNLILGICFGVAFSQLFGWSMYTTSGKTDKDGEDNKSEQEKGED